MKTATDSTARSVYGFFPALLLIAGLSLTTPVALAQHPTHCHEHELHPVLSVPDFDGDGIVTSSDIREIAHRVGARQYVAYFDVNADGALNGRDIAQAARAMGKHSTGLDQQLASLFRATEKYRDRETAIADGYRPFTPVLKGHGVHLVRLPFLPGPTGLDPSYQNILDDKLQVAEPEGLNYDENGNLIAVFYYHGIDIKTWVLAGMAKDLSTITALSQQAIAMALHSALTGGMEPELFDSAEAMWHQHWGPCWDGLDYILMAADPSIVPQFNQHLFPQECAAQAQDSGRRQGWVPAFNMIHVWLYKLNPCGIFAGIHPDVAQGFPEEPIARPLAEWFQGMGIPYPF